MSYFFILIMALCFVQPVASFTVHVQLESSSEKGPNWDIHCEGGFRLRDTLAAEEYEELAGPLCSIRVEGKRLLVNNRKLRHPYITIEPREGFLTFNGQNYPGSFSIVADGPTCHLVNSVDLEEYVYCVLRAESWPGWPLEVNKAFAIMQRSYVVSKVLRARMLKKKGKRFLFDIGSTNKDQTYRGLHTSHELRRAVDETAGIVLAHKGKPIEAMYDCCCGGFVPAKMEDTNFKEAPYLARTKACTFCADCKIFQWEAIYDLTVAEELLHGFDPKLKNIRGMKVGRIDKGGVVHTVKVLVGKRWHTLSRRLIYSLFKRIKSYNFSITIDGKHLVFRGRGLGHLKGACQWGARNMVEHGWSYQDVLHFYYPGVNFMRVVQA